MRNFHYKATRYQGDFQLSDKKSNNPFDPWSFLPFNSNFAFPENDTDVGKKLKELKIIESWLQFNLEFTRSVIKTIEIKNEALSALRDFNKSHKNQGMEAFVDEMNKKIIGSSVKNAENWWKSLEMQMNSFIEETVQNPVKQTGRKTKRKKSSSKNAVKKKTNKRE